MSCTCGRFCFDPCCWPCGIPAQWPAWQQQPVWPSFPPTPPCDPTWPSFPLTPPCPPAWPCCPPNPSFPSVKRPSYVQLVKTTVQTPLTASGVITFTEQMKTNDITTSGGIVTFSVPGTYKVDYLISAKVTSLTGGNVLVYLRTNGTAIAGTQSVITPIQTVNGRFGGSATIQVTAPGQTLELFADFTGVTGGSLTVDYGNLFAIRISK